MQEVIFFVYYKIPFSLHDQSLQQITKFYRGVLQKYPGVTCELMQRPDISSDGIEVWLETYRGVKKDISQEFITFLIDNGFHFENIPSVKLNFLNLQFDLEYHLINFLNCILMDYHHPYKN